MSDDTYRWTDDFPPRDAARWRETVAKELKGKPWEKLIRTSCAGLSIQPLYTHADWDVANDPTGFPGSAPHTRGGIDPAQVPDWDVRPEFTHPDPVETNTQILRDVSRGATSVSLRLDPSGHDGGAIRSVDDLDTALADVDLSRVPIVLDAGSRFGPAAELLDSVWERRGVKPAAALGAYQADPLSAWTLNGKLPVDLDQLMDQMTALAQRTATRSPLMRSVIAQSGPFHDAGADEVQELAFTLSSGLVYLKTLVAAGLDIDAAACQMQFSLSVGGEMFGEIAKLRAARQIWGRIVSASGGGDAAQRMHILSRTSTRMMTRRDPWVNILRATTAAFAAITGGADAVTVMPFDALDAVPDGFSRRVARNVQVVLQEESRLGHVIDPAGGSWHLEARTAELAAAVWTLFQEVEGRGGLVSSLRDGWIQNRIADTRTVRERDAARRKTPVTGVSEYPFLDETPVSRPRPEVSAGESPCDLALDGEDGRPHDIIPILPPYRTSEPFESLRDAADAHRERTGARPRVFLCTLGTLAQFGARITWIGNALAAGGVETGGGQAYADATAAVTAFRECGSPVAVICSSDDIYADLGPDTAAALREAGAVTQILAGRYGDLEDRWRAAGVGQVLYAGCDVLEILRGLHEVLEVNS